MAVTIDPVSGISANALQFLVGQVIHIAGSAAPTGFLKCSGAAVSRTTYGALFAICGTTFGAGDGSTTFNVPDLRGEFIRGLDDGRGIDSGRVHGSAQADNFKSHSHNVGIHVDNSTNGPYARSTANAGVSWYDPTTATGGTETRPRNIALLACIFTGV